MVFSYLSRELLTILWGNWEYKKIAANALKLTAKDMKKIGLIDEIIKEPLGGAHTFSKETFRITKRKIKNAINEFIHIDKDLLVNNRMKKFSKYGNCKGIRNGKESRR